MRANTLLAVALAFCACKKASIEEPHLYRYSYASQDGKSFIAKAAADLDCDGRESAYVMTGMFDAQGNPQIEIAPPPRGVY